MTKELDITRDVVTAYVTNNTLPAQDVPQFFETVFDSVNKAARLAPGGRLEDLKPAVPVKKSITADYIICLEDGKKFKSLKRHLRTHYNLSPEEYREKWGLAHDYPMVAPNYAAARSKLAKKMGLGQRSN